MNDLAVVPPRPSAPSIPPNLYTRVRRIRDALLTDLVERDVAIRLALIAALAGEHMLLVGPPGTAKSLLARRLRVAFPDASYFERLLTRFTVPEELFGPLSIRGLEEDRYERLTESYLPTASIAFLDEIFKANSAILNSLLTLLNEREFDNGTKRVATPLIAVIGASNELPDEGSEELEALFDRFLLRLHVGPVSDNGFRTLLQLRGESVPEVPDNVRLSAADLRAIQDAALYVEVPADVEALLCDLRELCDAERIAVSDRRWRKIVKLLQVAALTHGRTTVSVWDCWLLQHCLWNRPEDRKTVYGWYAARVGASAAMDPTRLTKIVVALESCLTRDQESRSQQRDAEGRPLYRSQRGEPTTEIKGPLQKRNINDEPLWLAPADACRMQGHWSSAPISDRTNGGKGYTRQELSALHIRQQDSVLPFDHWPERDAYLGTTANMLMVDSELPPLMEPTRHKRAYVESRRLQIDELRIDVEAYAAQLAEHTEALEREVTAHLWVTPEFAGPATVALEETRGTVDGLLARIAHLRKGFESLPLEPGDAP